MLQEFKNLTCVAKKVLLSVPMLKYDHASNCSLYSVTGIDKFVSKTIMDHIPSNLLHETYLQNS